MSILSMLLANLGPILQGVLAVEAALTATKSGAAKKAVIMSAVQAAAQAGETMTEAHVQAYSKVIDATVTALNDTGVLKHA